MAIASVLSELRISLASTRKFAMPRSAPSGVSHRSLITLLVEHRKLWIAPMLIAAVLAGVMTLMVPRKWKATQGLLIRPEVAGLGSDRLGKFSDLSEMKTLQETLLELARSKSVVTQALEKVGPRKAWFGPKHWPTAQDVADFRDAMVMTPPGGAEFGKTEVFYLGVLDKDPKRAAALVAALSEALEERTKEIRQKQATSMIAEVQRGVDQAQADLNAKIATLGEFESNVGASLSDLRSLLNPIGGSSETSQDVLAIHAEIRSNESERRSSQKLLEVLRGAQNDPTKLIATPNTLLASQPSVARLKQGLVDSQLAKARLMGRFSAKHPLVLAAEESAVQIRQELHDELATAIRGVEIELALSHDRDQALDAKLKKHQDNQRKLANHRAAYSQLVADVENQTQLVDTARTRLAEAQGQQAGAQSSSLLSRIDEVESGLRPVGASRSTVVAAGGLFGLLLGLGFVFWRHGPSPVSSDELQSSAPYGGKPVDVTKSADFGFGNGVRSRRNLSDAIATGFETKTL